MTFNLIHERWIPVRRQDGTEERIAPWEVTQDLEQNPFIALAAPRPDFNGALIQFLIGLVQTTIAPKDDRAWRTGLTQLPEPARLKEAFESVAFAFDLDGTGPRFMQEARLKDGERHPASYLLIDAPTKKPRNDNTDHFVKRELFERAGVPLGLCFPCVSAALFTLQLFGPQGGAGKFVGLRGGGPITTLIAGGNLWETIWLNVLRSGDIQDLGNVTDASSRFDEKIFPWLGPDTLVEEKTGKSTYLADVRPLHMYWAMPRRILLDFQNATENCMLCDKTGQCLVFQYQDATSGIHYKPPWRHPLSPHYRNKDGTLLPQHGRPTGVSYRHWLGWVLADTSSGEEPARVVHEFSRRQQWSELHEVLNRGPRLWAFGYNMAQMNPRAWCEGTMPLLQLEEAIRPTCETFVAGVVRTAELIAGNVRRCIKQAIFRRPSDVSGDLSHVDARFWQTTESSFYSLLEQCRDKVRRGDEFTPLKMEWLKTLALAGERIFDDLSQNNQLEVADPKRIALAARELRHLNAPTNKRIRQILDLPTRT
jgi:CRISPR system Cascade subunit CasA